MKFITILFFTFFLISSCNPLDLNEKGGKKDRTNQDFEFNIDPAKGEKNFKIPDLKNISSSEIIDKTQESCKDYKTTFVSILGEDSFTKDIASCIAKAIDDGLAPLCEDEEKAKELLKYYTKKKDEVGIEEVENYLYELEDLKYETADEIYRLADQVDDQCIKFDNSMDRRTENEDHWLKELFYEGVKFVGSSECVGLRSAMDSKARTVCTNFDLDRLINRR